VVVAGVDSVAVVVVDSLVVAATGVVTGVGDVDLRPTRRVAGEVEMSNTQETVRVPVEVLGPNSI
jgi:hypothetical protein